jgi:hypothetical protein
MSIGSDFGRRATATSPHDVSRTPHTPITNSNDKGTSPVYEEILRNQEEVDPLHRCNRPSCTQGSTPVYEKIPGAVDEYQVNK